MKSTDMKTYRKRTIIAVAIAAIVALIFAVCVTLSHVESTLNSSSESVTKDFTAIMDEYTHSFQLMSQMMQQEIKHSSSTDEIEAHLKESDATLGKIEGNDYDGIYMYYDNRYIYSWDKPYSEYEATGYVATERPWYTGAVAAKGKIWFSVPYRSYANDYMLATISQLQPDGKTVLAYDIKLGAIQDYATSLNVYGGGLALLCDKDGNIIATTQTEYDGGNYTTSDDEWDKQIKEAEQELKKQTKGEAHEKAQLKVDNLKKTKEFCAQHGAGLKVAADNPTHLNLDFKTGNVEFAYSNDRYTCLILIPFIRLLPMMLGIWVVTALVLILSILLVENILVRLGHSKEMEDKNIQLADAVVRADAANVAKSQFLAQMSHEIRTPMNAIIGLTAIAKMEVTSPDRVSDYLSKIEGSSKLLLSIINDVLDMSAIEGGKLKIDEAEFNFRRLLTGITTVFYEQARQKNINFEVRMNGITEEVMVGDELRVNQVLMNLLSNAIKFTPAGGEIDLMVLQASQSQGKVQLRFSVSDTGCGMSEEMLGRLFQPFEQESASTAKKHGGSGLGLSITKRLVEMMGGTIKVQSHEGKGSVFTADIPFGLPRGDADVETQAFTEIRVLVVDDDKGSCEYTGILLERLGVRYDYVTSGEAALEAMGEAEDQEDPYNLCLIDWKMPEMDGGELTEQIREIFGEDAITVIVSAYDLNEVEASGRAIGSNYFIPKPLFQSTLFNALMKISGGDYTQIEAENTNKDYDFTGREVLIAEDVVLNMEVAVKLLQMVGISVTCAEDGKQALDVFKQSEPYKFDCILLDINMPVMDGYEAAQAIRKCNRDDATTIPIYAMTANAFAEDVTEALDNGMDGHIAKPIETAILYRTLAKAFDEKDKNIKE